MASFSEPISLRMLWWQQARTRYFTSGMRRVIWTIAIVLTLSGCGGRGLTADPVPDLRVPGAVRITALDDLLSQTHATQISDLAAYAGPAPARSLHLLVRVGKRLYDVDVDRQQARLLDDAVACTEHIEVSPDSAWAACRADDEGIRMFPLPPSLNSPATGTAGSTNPLGDRLVLPNEESDEVFYSPTWSPDGRTLAVLWDRSGKPPALAFYSMPAAHDTLRSSAVIELAGAATRSLAISWSPDGAWLQLAVVPSTVGVAVYLVPARPLLASPGMRTLDPDQFTGVVPGFPGSLIWRPSDSTLTFVDGQSIVVRVPGAGHETPLLTIPDGDVCGLAWSPDGAGSSSCSVVA